VHPGVIPEGFGFLAAEEGFFQLAGGFFHTGDQFGEPGQEPENAVVFDPGGGEGVIGRRRFPGEICGGGEDLTAGHFRHGGAFDVYHLAVVFQHHLITGFAFDGGHDPQPLHQLNVFRGDGGFHGVYGIGKVREAPAGGFLHPLVGVVVAVEDDAAVLFHGILDDAQNFGIKVIAVFQTVGEFPEGVGHDGVEHITGHRHRGGGAYHPELELIAGEGEGGGAVPVGAVLRELRQGGHAGLQQAGRGLGNGVAVGNVGKNPPQLVTQKDGDNAGRCFVGT